MQVGHGKCAPLKRLRAGDVVAYYAPAQTMGGKDKLQSFVSIGVVQPGEPYAFDMGGGFVPHRRDVRYVSAQPAPIAPLLDALDFVEDRQRWGHRFRFGLLAVCASDMQRVAHAMRADTAALGWAGTAWVHDAPSRPTLCPCSADPGPAPVHRGLAGRAA